MYNSLDFVCKYQLQEQEKEETLFNEGKNITGYLVVLIMASTHKNKSYKLKKIYIIFLRGPVNVLIRHYAEVLLWTICGKLSL